MAANRRAMSCCCYSCSNPIFTRAAGRTPEAGITGAEEDQLTSIALEVPEPSFVGGGQEQVGHTHKVQSIGAERMVAFVSWRRLTALRSAGKLLRCAVVSPGSAFVAAEADRNAVERPLIILGKMLKGSHDSL